MPSLPRLFLPNLSTTKKTITLTNPTFPQSPFSALARLLNPSRIVILYPSTITTITAPLIPTNQPNLPRITFLRPRLVLSRSIPSARPPEATLSPLPNTSRSLSILPPVCGTRAPLKCIVSAPLYKFSSAAKRKVG